MAGERDAYRLLGVSPDSTPAEVRAAFRKKVMEQHPDTAASGSDQSGVQELVDAYRLLATPRPAPNSGEKARLRSGTGARRVRVRHVADGSAADPRLIEGACLACGGTGRRAESVRCPDCGGSERVTILEVNHARVAWCPTCHGRGRRRLAVRCHVCDGSGAV